MRSRFLLMTALVALSGCTTPDAAETEPEETPATDATTPGGTQAGVPSTSAAPAPPLPEALSAAQLLSPSTGATRVDGRTVAFSWVAARASQGSPVSMRVLISGQPLAECPAQVGRTSCAAKLANGVSYSWEVEATTPGGLRVTSAPATFRTNAPPTAATPVFPPAGSHAMMPDSSFTFSPGSDPDGDRLAYVVEIQDASGGVRTLPCAPTCAPRLPVGQAFSWRVIASDGLLLAMSASIPFRTNAPPAAPSFDAGFDGMVQVPMEPGQLQWRTASDPDGDALVYEVQATLGGQRTFSCTGLAVAACAHPRLRAGQTYTLAVTAADGYGLRSEPATARFTTRLPVVFLHGWNADHTTWEGGSGAFEEAGYEVLDFSSVTGTQLLRYLPDREDEGIVEIAATDVAPAIEAALAAEGYARDQRVDVIAHSMGGLVARVLVEKPARYQGGFSIDAKWATQVRTLTMVGTPNHGSTLAGYWACSWGDNVNGVDVWEGSCHDMEEDSWFLTTFLGEGPATGKVEYHTIAGGDDDVVDERSVPLRGAVSHLLIPEACHTYAGCGASSLPWHPEVYDRFDAILGPRLGA